MKKNQPKSAEGMIRIGPHQYVHVLDNVTNTTKIIEGPVLFSKMDHESLVKGPVDMIKLPPNNYCIIENPVVKDKEGKIVTIQYKEAISEIKLNWGKQEIRYSENYPEHFPLYPGEELKGGIKKYTVVPPNQALVIRANCNFVNKKGKEIQAGDEWLFTGPGTYKPIIEEDVCSTINALVIQQNQALKLRAKRDLVDKDGLKRKAGEIFLYSKPGAYMIGVDEEKIEFVKGFVITDKTALHLRAIANFTDRYNVPRKSGDEWLLTIKNSEFHILHVSEELVRKSDIITLTNRQYCIIIDPMVDGINLYGKKVLKKGDTSFFLQPGEKLEKGIQDIIILTDTEALLLQALCDFIDEEKVTHKAGSKWLKRGPCEYFPNIEIKIIERRRAIPLDENEGIYVRDMKTGVVRSVKGKTYMLETHETLWEKQLSKEVEELIYQNQIGESFSLVKTDKEGNRNYSDYSIPSDYKRDKTRIVTFKAKHNSAVQLYDYKKGESRIVFGPGLVMLEPYEEVTVLNLSGDVPKVENKHKNIALLLGPDFMTDLIIVETVDHAKLRLKMSYNWVFEVQKGNPKSESKMFTILDFVGEACKAMASRIRGTVSQNTFEQFHKNAPDIINKGVFKYDSDGKPIPFVMVNNLKITSVDVQNIEVADKSTRETLEKAINLSIDIDARSKEAQFKHMEEEKAEDHKGASDLQLIKSQIIAQKERIKLIELQTKSMSVESSGKAVAEAKAIAERIKIKGEAEESKSKLQVEARKVTELSELDMLKKKNATEIEKLTAMNNLEITTKQKLADIEVSKFENMMDALGKDTIVAMAKSGPETQSKLLKGLGLQGFMVVDGKNPINLMGIAQGMIGKPEEKSN